MSGHKQRIFPPEVSPELWEKQVDEPEKEWRYFQEWRDTRPRSVAAFAVEMGIPESTMCGYHDDFVWHARCAAYDRFLDAARTSAALEHQKRQARRRAALIGKAQELLDKSLDTLLTEVAYKPASPQACARLLDVVIKLERLEAGQSTENIAAAASVDLRKLSDAELEQLEALTKKAQESAD